MSIWCSLSHIGTDPTVMYEVGDGLYEVDLNGGTEGRTPVAQRAEGGNVLGYAEGFSNHYPDLTAAYERPAAIALATIPHWCVPGVEEGDCEYESVGQWLRIEVAVPESLLRGDGGQGLGQAGAESGNRADGGAERMSEDRDDTRAALLELLENHRHLRSVDPEESA